MKPFELSSTAWALAKLHAAGRLPDELATAEVVNALHDAAAASVAWMNAQASANTLWAFSRLEPPPPPALCDALLRRAEACARHERPGRRQCLRRVRASAAPPTCRCLLRSALGGASLGATDLGEIAWALGVMVAATPEALPPPRSRSRPRCGARRRSRASTGRRPATWSLGCAALLRRLGGVWAAKAAVAAAAAAEAPIRSAALEAVRAAQERRGDVDAAAAAAAVKAAPWSALPRGATVLLALTPSAGGASESLEAALQAAGLKVRHWRRMSGGRRGGDGMAVRRPV